MSRKSQQILYCWHWRAGGGSARQGDIALVCRPLDGQRSWCRQRPASQTTAIDELNDRLRNDQLMQPSQTTILKDLRVLIAEDIPSNSELLEILLAEYDCKVETVTDGQKALTALERSHFDVVLMDCQMPVIDGLQATKELRHREADSDRHTIVIGVTANAMESDREACLAAGMDDYVSKPIMTSDLIRRIVHWSSK